MSVLAAFITADASAMCAEPDGRVVANRTAVAQWEIFEVFRSDDGSGVGFRTHHGNFVCAEPDGRLLANRDSLRQWETFKVEIHGDGQVSLRTYHSTYISAGGGAAHCGAMGIGANERLYMVPSDSFVEFAELRQNGHSDVPSLLAAAALIVHGIRVYCTRNPATCARVADKAVKSALTYVAKKTLRSPREPEPHRDPGPNDKEWNGIDNNRFGNMA